MNQSNPEPEFSRVLDVPREVAGEAAANIAATQEERAALALRFSLLSLGRLESEVRLARLTGGFVRLTATLSAELMQECVITLEPVPTHLEERFSLLYGPVGEAREIVLEGEAETVEPLIGNRIDIGEAVAQQLSLALEPFPHAPGAEEMLAAPPGEEAARELPFAALKHWPGLGKPRS